VQRIAAALFVIASFVLAAAGARAAPVPKALCFTWQNNLIQGDNMDLDVVLRPAQGTFRTQHVADGPVKYKLYAVHGFAGGGDAIAVGSLPPLAGTAVRRTDGEELELGILMITSGWTYTFRGTHALGGGDFPMSRTDPDGNSSDGTAIELDCSGATVSG
jgi:hypothetical protein